MSSSLQTLRPESITTSGNPMKKILALSFLLFAFAFVDAQPHERSILDPLGRENRGLVNSRRIVQRVAQEVLVLERVALRHVDQGRVVEHVLSHRGADQEADVEVIPVDLAVEAEREIGVRVAED